MKKYFCFSLLLVSSGSYAWGGYYPGWWPGNYGQLGYGSYNYGMNSMSVIQTPSFNYNTTIIQSPPIIINQTGDVVAVPNNNQATYGGQPPLERR
jgi:hypothetical protein